MEKLQEAYLKFTSMQVKLLKYHILVNNPGLFSEEWINHLKERRAAASEDERFGEVMSLSSNISWLEQCRDKGLVESMWGYDLSQDIIESLNREIPGEFKKSIEKTLQLQKTKKYMEAIRVLEPISRSIDHEVDWLLHAMIQERKARILIFASFGKPHEALDRGLEIFHELHDLYERHGFSDRVASMHFNLAAYYRERVQGKRSENIEKAIDYSLKCAEYFSQVREAVNGAKNMVNLANCFDYRIEGNRAENLEKAIELYSKAQEVLNKDDFPLDWALIQNNMSNSYKERIRGDRAANLEKAIELLESAREIWTFRSFPLRWAGIQINLAPAYQVRIQGDRAENLETAIRLMHQALEILTREKYPALWAHITNNLSNTYYKRILGNRSENMERAIELSDASLEVFKKEAYPEYWASSVNSLAAAYQVRIEGNRGDNLEKALELLEAALEVVTFENNPEVWAKYNSNLARAYRRRIEGDPVLNLKKAVKLFNESMKVYQPYTLPRKCRDTAVRLAEIFILLENWDSVLDTAEIARKADRILQQQAATLAGKSHEIEESASLYYLAAYASSRKKDIFGAAEWLEHGRTREIGEALNRNRVIMEEQLTAREKLEYSDIVERMKILEAEQRGVTPEQRSFTEIAKDARNTHLELERLIESIQKRIPEFQTDTVADRKEIESLLTDDSKAYVLFNVTDFGTVVHVLTSLERSRFGGTFYLETFSTERMRVLVEKWTESLASIRKEGVAGDSKIEEIALTLYRELFMPVHEWLVEKGDKIRKLVFVPHLSLHVMPLHLMMFESNGNTRYLLEDYEITFAPSLSLIARPAGRKSKRKPLEKQKMIIVADPTGDLEWSSMEADSISKKFPGESRILSRENASTGAFFRLCRDAAVLHLSCHGVFDPVDPWNSGIILHGQHKPVTGKEEEPGEKGEAIYSRDSIGKLMSRTRSLAGGGRERTLYSSDGGVASTIRHLPDGSEIVVGEGELVSLKRIVAEMDLSHTVLVVLSACESGLVGFAGRSDEFIGLPGGFLRAGARNVVASFWAVDDLSTSLFMAEFYTGISEENLEPEKALRRTQLKFLASDEWKSPYYWGAFRFLGE